MTSPINALYPRVFEITDGADVSKSLFDYARREGERDIFLSSAIGVVGQFTLH
jgi:hypothetical protein